MPHAKFDDRYDDHRKIKRAWRRDRSAVGLHAMAITYCSRFETDGVVDAEWLEERIPKARERESALAVLVDCDLFERLEDGHYVIHDYLQWNHSKAKRAELREKSRKGGQARWGKGDTSGQTSGETSANGSGHA